MAKGRASSSSALALRMMARISSRKSAWRWGATKKPMPPPDMPPSMRKPQKSSPRASRLWAMMDSVKRLLTQGMICLRGPSQLSVVSLPRRLDVAGFDGLDDVLEDGHGLLAGLPFLAAAEEVFLGDHVEDGADILGHAAVDEDEAFGQGVGEGGGSLGPGPGKMAGEASSGFRERLAHLGLLAFLEEVVQGEEPAAADAPFGVLLGGGDARMSLTPGKTPPESCQPPPEPPSHSPRMARATTTRAVSGSSGPVRSRAWPVARMKRLMSEASRLVETARREPLGMSLTLLTISMPKPGRTTWPRISCKVVPVPSKEGGIRPAAMMPALMRPR